MTPPNDWSIKKCLAFSLGLLLAMLGLIGLASLGYDVPVLRQLVGFIFLAFVPGILILRILKIHNISIIESLLYSVGLSLAFVMATGVVANFALPLLGISHPITLAPLIVTLVFFFLILCSLAYVRDKNFRPPKLLPGGSRKVGKPKSLFADLTPFLLAILLPLLAILGASLVNSYYNNTLLFVLIFLVIVIIGLVTFNRFIPPRVYPLMIFMMALALIYQTTLISNYLVGSDIHGEYYFAKLVAENGIWNANIAAPLDSCLSIVMLAPIYSLLLNMDIVWLFKIIYPLFFCLAPLALFHIFRLQIKPLYAFLATFFFISMPMFVMDMAQLCRQQVAELFFVLVILLMVDRKLTLMQRVTLVLVFGAGVVVSHYGLGTGYVIGYLLVGALILVFIKSRPGRTLWQWLIGKSRSLPADLTSAGAFNKKTLAIIVGVGLVLMLGYYNVVASGTPLSGTRVATSVTQGTVEQVVSGVTTPPTATTTPPPTGVTPPPTDTTTPATVELPGFVQNLMTRFPMLNPFLKEPLTQTALGLDFSSASPGGKVWRIFQYLVELCLIVGFFRLIFRPKRLDKFKAEYISLTIVSVLVLLGIFVLPGQSYGAGTSRIWQITLLLMSPLFLFGGEVIGRGIARLARVLRRGFASSQLSPNSPVPLRFLVLAILIPYFIFNSGVVFELSRSQATNFINMPYSIALSGYRVDVTTVFRGQDITAADWLSEVAGDDYAVYADAHGINAFVERYEGRPMMALFPTNIKDIPFPNYIYFRAWNTEKKTITFPTAYGARQSISFNDILGLTQLTESGSRIYNNGGAQVLLPGEGEASSE